MSERSISQWIHNAIVEGSYRKFDDLHIDDIDADYENPSVWLPASLGALAEAAKLRDRGGWPFTIALAIPLAPASRSGTAMQLGIEQLSGHLGDTPPSLYAFEQGSEPWANNRDEFVELAGFIAGDQGGKGYFTERPDPDEDGEYQRTVWIAR
jgi:hypothetical protein